MLMKLIVDDEHVYTTIDYMVMICYPWLWNGNLDIYDKKYEMLILIWMFKFLKNWNCETMQFLVGDWLIIWWIC